MLNIDHTGNPEWYIHFCNPNLFCVSLAEDFSDSEDILPKEITKWNSNELMDKIEAADAEGTPGMKETRSVSSGTATLPQYVMRMCLCVTGELFNEMSVDYERATSEERLDEVCWSDRQLELNTQPSLLCC